MFYYLSKVLPLLLLPVPLALAIALLALGFVLRGKRRPSIVCLLTAILVLWVSSLPAVASRLLWSLEGQHLPVDIDSIPASDCIVVLGGALGQALYPRVEIELTDAADRVYQASRLYLAGKGRAIIVAAGNQPWALDAVPEARHIEDLLVEWGVPRNSIALDTASRNTRENALNAMALIHESGCQSSLLVTSAWHMPRAVASFKRVGVEVFPVSVDVRLVQGDINSIDKYIPRADALATTSLAMLEWMGIWVYRFRDWN